MLMLDMSVLILSCDKNEDIWQPFFKLYNKYYKHNYNTYILTEKKECKYANTIKISANTWTERVNKALKQIPNKKVLVLLDDFFIHKPVDVKRIENIVFDSETAVYNFECSYLKTSEEWILRKNKSMYLCSCQPSLWDREKLIELTNCKKSPWEWELQIIDSPYKFYINSKDLIFDIGYYKERKGWGLVQGKWAVDTIKLFKKEKIQIDYSKRGVYDLILSVIIPYYNTPKETKTLLDNLCKQKTDEIEIILINDGCKTDFSKYDITVINNTSNEGVSRARNKGLEIAQGKYITFIDSDDNVPLNYFKSIIKKCEQDFDYCYFSWNAQGKDYIIDNEPPEWNTSVWNCIYNRKTIGTTRFDENLTIGEDAKFNSIVRKGKKRIINEVLYYYNWGRNGSLTNLYQKGKISRENKTNKISIIVYNKNTEYIGGIAKFLNEFFSQLKNNFDITFVYDECDKRTLEKFKKNVKCVKFDNQCFITDYYLGISIYGDICKNVIASEYLQMVHADLVAIDYKFTPNKFTDRYIVVSEVAKNSFLKLQPNAKCEVIYNLLDMPKPKKVLNLISATRLSKEKGKQRIIALAEELNKNNIPFLWNVFTDENINVNNVITLPFTDNIQDYIANADYLVQLSDTESWGYSMVEALELGIPIITTDIPILKEIGFIDGVNGFKLPLDMSNMRIEEIYNANLKFEYKKKDKKERWVKTMPKPKKVKKIDVKIIKKYTDMELNRTIDIGEVIDVTMERARQLIDAGVGVINDN